MIQDSRFKIQDSSKKQVVVLGAGFAGVACARSLASQTGGQQLTITIVDARPFQLYPPTLYEVLCTFETGASAARVRTSTAITLADIFQGLPVIFQQAHVKHWEAESRVVYLDSGELPYDILVIALGATSEYFGVPGAQEYAWPLKTFEDALRLRNALASEFQRANGPLNVVISGGGFTGVEAAAELACAFRRLEKITDRFGHIVVLEGCPQLLAGMDSALALRVRKRLERLGVEVRLNELVKKVTRASVELASGERIRTRFVLWTAGVRACPLPGATKEICGIRGRISVDRFLRVAGHNNVYAIGDIACVVDHEGKPLPQTASLAIEQGQYVARSISRTLQKQTLNPYIPHFQGYVIPAGGKYAFFVSPSGFILEGFFAWVLRRLIDLRYWFAVLPNWKAFALWLRATRLFIRND
jgi:NADH dehydrogenase